MDTDQVLVDINKYLSDAFWHYNPELKDLLSRAASAIRQLQCQCAEQQYTLGVFGPDEEDDHK